MGRELFKLVVVDFLFVLVVTIATEFVWRLTRNIYYKIFDSIANFFYSQLFLITE